MVIIVLFNTTHVESTLNDILLNMYPTTTSDPI